MNVTGLLRNSGVQLCLEATKARHARLSKCDAQVLCYPILSRARIVFRPECSRSCSQRGTRCWPTECAWLLMQTRTVRRPSVAAALHRIAELRVEECHLHRSPSHHTWLFDESTGQLQHLRRPALRPSVAHSRVGSDRSVPRGGRGVCVPAAVRPRHASTAVGLPCGRRRGSVAKCTFAQKMHAKRRVVLLAAAAGAWLLLVAVIRGILDHSCERLLTERQSQLQRQAATGGWSKAPIRACRTAGPRPRKMKPRRRIIMKKGN